MLDKDLGTDGRKAKRMQGKQGVSDGGKEVETEVKR